jgi:hypothetical protein
MAKVVENEITVSVPVTMEYSSEARTVRVTRLHFVELYLIILPFHVKESSPEVSLPIVTIYPIWELRSWLLVKEPLIKTKILACGRAREI